MTIYYAMAIFLCCGFLFWKEPTLGSEDKNICLRQNIFLVMAGIMFVTVATMRYGIGFDYFNYKELYERLGAMTVQQLLADRVGRQFIGYSLFTRLVCLLHADYTVLLLVVNIFLTAIVLWFVKSYSPLPWLSLYLYLTLQFFAHSMNLFRQSIAATICLLAYPFLKKRRFIPFLLVVLLASSFHLSALFFVPFYWILSWKPSGRLFIALSAAALPVYLFSNQAAQFLTQYIFPNYAGYIGSRYWQGLGYRYAVFPVIYFAAAALCMGRLISKDNDNRLLVNSSFYVMWLYIFSTHHMILERFSIYLFMYSMLLLPKLAVSFIDSPDSGIPKTRRQKQKRDDQRTMAFIAAALVIVCGFCYLIFASQQGTNGFHKVYPYVSALTHQ